MRHNFLLDENLVVIGGQHHTTAAQVWLGIGKNCHRIGVDPILYGKYKRKLNSAEARLDTIGGTFARVVHQILKSDKVIWITHREESDLTVLIRDDDDRFLVDVAVGVSKTTDPSECVVVTGDEKTREDFNHSEFHDLGISGVTPESGVTLAGEACP